MKLLDWGEDGVATDAEAAALRASFRQEVAVWHELEHPNVTKVTISMDHVLNPVAIMCDMCAIHKYHGHSAKL